MLKKISIMLFSLLLVSMALSGCGHNNSKLSREQMKLHKQGTLQVGMPAITNFQQQRFLKDIYQMSDKPMPTFAYIKDLYGHLHLLCNSIGYGIPYATQYDNPDRLVTGNDGHSHVIPQPDPDDLYHPSSAAGTWVMCINPVTKKPTPVYVEPNVVVSPFKLNVK